MRLLLDVCAASRPLFTTLADLGHDVLSSWDRPPPRASDEVLLALAREEGRVVITEGKDFGELVFSRGLPHPGIVRLVEMTPMERALLETTEGELSGCCVTGFGYQSGRKKVLFACTISPWRRCRCSSCSPRRSSRPRRPVQRVGATPWERGRLARTGPRARATNDASDMLEPSASPYRMWQSRDCVPHLDRRGRCAPRRRVGPEQLASGGSLRGGSFRPPARCGRDARAPKGGVRRPRRLAWGDAK